MYKVTSPILFLIFNRPNETRQVFEAIKQAKPARLYVAADGPRKESERKACEAARAIIGGVDWDCEVETLFRENNLGCGDAVSQAITWFFNEEPEGIILEDDCLPEPSFFEFCDKMLEKYRNIPEVGHISGTCYAEHEMPVKEMYCFSTLDYIWGWASWRRAWVKHYDKTMRAFPEFEKSGRMKELWPRFTDRQFWLTSLQDIYDGKVDTWDMQWLYSLWAAGMLSITPHTNMVKNIGFNSDATHTIDPESVHAGMATHPCDFNRPQPQVVMRDIRYDQFIQDHVYYVKTPWSSLKVYIKYCLKKIPGTRWHRTAKNK